MVSSEVKSTNDGLEDYDPSQPEKDLDGVNAVLMRTLTTFLQMGQII